MRCGVKWRHVRSAPGAYVFTLALAAIFLAVIPLALRAAHRNTVRDPGVRPGPAGAGGAFPNLNAEQMTSFNDGLTNFTNVHTVPAGLGPRFDSDQCSMCHTQPAVGGSGPAAPATNPLFSVYQLDGATNTMPSFETATGPILVARFPYQADLTTRDGTVHQLFTVTGRTDAHGCNITQPDFAGAQSESNIAFRQPLPTFGDGLLELIANASLTSNMAAVCAQTQLGICGTPSIDEHDGTVNRLGWKAQWRGLNLAAGEEYNVEEGVTNEFYLSELDQTAGCVFNPVPESGTNFSAGISPDQFTGDPERMANYMRFLAPPAPAKLSAAAQNGQTQFISIGCVLCHTQSFTTPSSSIAVLSRKAVSPYSDLLLHHMGPCLADNVIQGSAQGDMFRTPPLWGAGKRMFFLHDGRTSDLLEAIQDHFCAGNAQYPASEANGVINSFNALMPSDQQDVLYFIRSL
jgi:CxxC motif-containing protein (DUF1111 family)